MTDPTARRGGDLLLWGGFHLVRLVLADAVRIPNNDYEGPMIVVSILPGSLYPYVSYHWSSGLADTVLPAEEWEDHL